MSNEIAIRQKIDLTDRDKDGLPDVYEIRGMKPSNGDAPFYTDPGNPDTDGDGLLDGEEVVATPFLHIIKAFDDAGVSCSNAAGHAFLVYQSFVDDTLDFTRLAGGYEYMTWEQIGPCEYDIEMNEYVAIGSTSITVDNSGLGFETDKHINDGDDKGIYFNREFAEAKSDYDEKYNKDKPDKYKKAYGKNKAYSRLITEEQMKKVIKYCEEHEYYNVCTNNCAKTAVKAWNKAFDREEFTSTLFPSSLKDEIGEKSGSFTFDLYKILGIEI